MTDMDPAYLFYLGIGEDSVHMPVHRPLEEVSSVTTQGMVTRMRYLRAGCNLPMLQNPHEVMGTHTPFPKVDSPVAIAIYFPGPGVAFLWTGYVNLLPEHPDLV